MEYDIIGGGIIGVSIAREILLRKKGEVRIFEKEHTSGMHASSRNSGVIHSGINQKPGTYKAEFCVKGSAMLRAYCRENNVPMEECGTLVIARNEKEYKGLQEVFELGKKVGVPNLRIICPEELKEREPSIAKAHALISPTGAIVNSSILVKSLFEETKKLGAEIYIGEEVKKITQEKIITTRKDYKRGDHLINAAGLYADKIAHIMGEGKEYEIIPFRGEYMDVPVPLHSMVYQVPDLRYPFLGIHLTKNLEGKVLAGPNAMVSFGRESYNKEYNLKESVDMISTINFWKLITKKEFMKLAFHNAKTSFFKKEFTNEVNAILERKISKESIIPYRAGIRAQLIDNNGEMVNDFKVIYGQDTTHVLNAVSPGMTCSLAFAEYLIENIQKNGKK